MTGQKTDLTFAYVTTPDLPTAQAIARAAVEENLAACANFWPGMRSVYRWEGRVEEAQEAVLILKTRAELLPRLAQRVAELHPYAVPCVVGLPVSGGHAPYLDWLRSQSGGEA